MRLEENVFVSLGSNLGDRQACLDLAGRELAGLDGTKVTGRSAARLTEAVGPAGQPDFLNQVQRLETVLPPEALLERLLAIETRLGRVRTVRWGPRVIDLDILFYGDLTCRTATLRLPHPELGQRPFFLEMIAEIDSGFLKGRHYAVRPAVSGGKGPADARGGN